MWIDGTGLSRLWWKWTKMNPTRCLEEALDRPVIPALKFKGLVGAFFVLGFGVVLSILAFSTEMMICRRFRGLKQAPKLSLCIGRFFQ